MSGHGLDVLIPTVGRPAALAVALTSLVGQTAGGFRVVVADQSEDDEVFSHGECATALRVLHARGHEVETHAHRPRLGVAEQRDFLLSRAGAPAVLFLDDDVLLEPEVVAAMSSALAEEGCGFVGCAVIGLSHRGDERPHEQEVEFWDGPVRPERVDPSTRAWRRHLLHNAANLYHVQRRLGVTFEQPRLYRVAWVGGCVLYDRAKLETVGGFSFWRELPRHHAGEDVLAQMRVMERYGGCGLMPSGVYHQELPTTIPRRDVDAPHALGLEA
ncbi:MAG: glycosyltransferase family 2 protein [Coriobacteriia bacterium]|nr:glycosyltransferase family 2 protein [Coriobacteriia bacterium]